MTPEQLQEAYAQYFYYIIAAGVAIGLVLGSIPLILGLRKKKRNLGMAGFFASGIVGGFSPLLSLIITALFIILVMRKAGDTSPAEPGTDAGSDNSD